MEVKHTPQDAMDIGVTGIHQMINSMLETAEHPGISQFRVGAVTVTILDTAVDVTFSNALRDADYQVFLQPQSNVSVITFADTLRASGFTLNLSVGVAATFSYMAVGNS